MHRPLPARFASGYTLTEADVALLHFDTDRRDRWIEIYQNMELAKNGDIAEKDSYIGELLRKVRAPVTGYALQVGESSGLYGDDWVSGWIQLRIRPGKPVKKLVVKGWRPENSPAEATITVRIDDRAATVAHVGHGIFEIPVSFDPEPEADYFLTIRCDVEFSVAGDSRPLAYMLMELRHEH